LQVAAIFQLIWLSFIDHSQVVLPSDLECQRQIFSETIHVLENDDVIMFPEGHKVENSLSSEDAELKRILGKQRTGFRDSLLDLLLQLHQKGSESQEKSAKPKTETRNTLKTIHEADADRNVQRRDAHGSPKIEAATCKFKPLQCTRMAPPQQFRRSRYRMQT